MKIYGNTPFESVNLHRDGRRIPVEVSISRIETPQGDLYISIVRDITERKQALRASEEKHRTLFEMMRHGVIYQDTQGAIIDANPAAERIVGLTLEQMQGRTSMDPRWHTIHEDGSPYPGETHPVMVALSTGKPAHGIMGVYNPQTDSYRWINVNAIPQFKTGENLPYQVSAMFEDVTERRQAEKALKESHAQLAATINALPDLMFEVDKEGCIHDFRAPNSEALYLPPEEFLGKNVSEILPAPAAGTILRAILEASEKGTSFGRFYSLPMPQGALWFEISIAAKDDAAAQDARFIALARDITQHKNAEAALSESEALYRRAIEVAGAVPYLRSHREAGMNYEFIGEGIRQITGYAPEEITDELWDAITEERMLLEDLAQYSWEEARRRVHSGESPIWKCEHRIRARDGKIHWVFESAIELRNEDGVSYGSIGLFEDVTERKRAEIMREVLLEITQGMIATKELRDFLSIAHHSIAKIVPAENFFILLYDKGAGLFEEAYSVDKFDPPGTPPAKLEKSLSAYIFRTGKPFLSTPESFNKLVADGEVELVGMESPSWLGVPLKTPNETIGVMVVQDYDVPNRFSEEDVEVLTSIAWQVGLAVERKWAEAALKESEELYRKMNENSPLGMHFYKLDSNGRLVFTGSNPAADKLLGVDNSQFVGMTINEAFPPLTQTEVPQRYRDAAAKGIPWSTEQIAYQDRHIAGAFEVRAFQTMPGNMVAVFADITARKQAEEEIRKFNDELEQRVQDRTLQLETTNKELEAFAYSISHDLRTPLRGIDGWSQALMEDYYDRLDEEGKKYIDRIRAEAQRMGHLIDDMLQLSRLTRAEMRKEAVDLGALALSIVERQQNEDPQRQVEFQVHKDMVALGDPHLLEAALTNLLSNAFKFTGKVPQARIEFGKIEQEGRRVFFVRDNGAGFDMAYAQKLFGAFQRMHKASEFPGTGIGLAIVQRVIHRHGGEIWVRAKVNEGAIFYFTLPE
jgi:PAS domain S-box-containing protein